MVAPEVAVPAPETAVPIPETPGVPEEGAKVPGLETPEQVPEERVQGPETLAASEKKSAKAYQIKLIEGIGTMYGEKMAAAGVFTTGDLLDTAASRKGRDDLVRRTGISGKLILEWVNRADLMRVPGIGEEYSDLLEAAGVDTVKELRRRKPESLHAKLYLLHRTDPNVKAVGYLGSSNLTFAGLLVLWLIYTPIAQKRGWFHIPM